MECLMFGVASPMAADVHGILSRLGWEVRAFVNGVEGAERSGGPEWTDLDAVEPEWLALPVVIPIFTPGHRRSALSQALDAGFVDFPAAVDPTAVVADSSVPGRGCVANAGAIVAANVAIGEFVHLNRGASVGHDNVIDDFASLGPGCVLTGDVRVGRGGFIGAGAVVNPGVHIGANAVVGAGSVVLRDVDPHTVVVGNPAETKKTGIAGYKDLSA